MSKHKSKATIYTDSEDESDSIEMKNGNGVSDYDSDQFEDDNKKLASSTHIEPKTAQVAVDVKLQLVASIRKMSVAQSKHTQAIKRIPWDKIKIDGYEQKELELLLQQIIKSVGGLRTLDEVLADYEKNQVKFDCASHPDLPSKPISAHFQYIMDNREKFTQILQKRDPSAKIPYTDVVKYGMEKFKNLVEKKKAPYLERYHAGVEEYNNAMKEFFVSHPELKKKKKEKGEGKEKKERKKKVAKEPKEKAVRKVKAAPNPTKVTPFSLYRDELSKDGSPVAFSIAQKMWKGLQNEEKGRYVDEVAKMDTTLIKQITKEEMKLMDEYNGIPKPFMVSPYTLFVHQFSAEYEGDQKSMMREAAEMWKTLSADRRNEINRLVDADKERWRREMEAYIKTLPKEQQAMMFQKHKVFQTTKRKNAENPTIVKKEKEDGTSKKANKSVAFKSDSESEADDPPPKKKKTTSESSQQSPRKLKIAESSQKSSGTEKIAESEPDVPRPKKKKTTSESSQQQSPRKQKVVESSPHSSGTEKNDDSEHDDPSPKKKKKTNSESSQQQSPRKQKVSESSVGNQQVPAKKTKKDESSQEQPSKKKKNKIPEPEYPSQSTAHYFMTQVYQGKPKRIAKAYRKLDAKEKKEYREKMIAAGRNYLDLTHKYLNSLTPAEAAEFKAKLPKLKKDQIESLAWHTRTGTDEEKKRTSSTSSESDSDSS